MMRLDIQYTAFDIDGVVLDIITPFLRLLEERHGYSGLTPDRITSFKLDEALGVPDEIVRGLVAELLTRPLELNALPYPGAAEVLESLCRQEPLLFITARPHVEPVRAWFESALPDLPPERYEIIATGDPLKKLDFLLDHGRRYFIDDHLETCRMLDAAGLQPLVYDQPWNRHDRDLPRVQGWTELALCFGLDLSGAIGFD